MPRKKKSPKKTGATRNPPPGRSNWSWGLIGLSTGCFIAFLIYLDKIPVLENEHIQESDRAEKKRTEKKQTLKEPKQKEKQKKQAHHQFEFYEVLPDRGVNTQSNVEPRREKIAPPQTTKTSIKPQSSPKSSPQPTAKDKKSSGLSLYQLQVGAFKDLAKADAMKAQLALMGVESNIQMINSQGQKIYKVRVGPSTSEQHIRRIQQQLKAKKISAFIQKLKA